LSPAASNAVAAPLGDEHHARLVIVAPARPAPALPAPPPVTSRAGSRYDRFVKPVLDRVVAAVLLVVLLPVLVVVAAALLVTLGRPLLYVQPRVGRAGRTFGMLKFRTMRPDRRRRDESVPAHLDRRRTHKSDADPRHTRIGRALRRSSLDELPQLWNVLRGDMSVVGPRPELPGIVDGYVDWQHQRHEVKPGITGLWQVTERSTSAGEMHLHTATDLVYLERLSLRTDLAILARTPVSLAKGR
jgi:lipopolysaccharide/colanic/teichoic acid biosynthesis glycosyltransferase